MALFQIDTEQFEHLDTRLTELSKAVTDLSDNVGKWQAQQTAVVQSGFAELIAAITGADVAEIQERINAASNRLDTGANQLKQSVDAATE